MFHVPEHALNDYVAVNQGAQMPLGLTPHTKMETRRVILVHAMPRSGHHAIIDWIHSQFDGPTFHLNCCDPRRSPAPGEPHKHRIELGDGFAAGLGVLNSKQPIKEVAYDLVTANFEGFDLRDESVWELSRRCDEFFYVPEDLENVYMDLVTHVIVIRDPFNNVASWQRSPWPDFGHMQSDVWCTHADEALQNTHLLNSPLVVINYNQWVTDMSYRHQVLSTLGIVMKKAEQTVVSTESSFDGFSKDGEPHKMAVNERWLQLTTKEVWDNRFVLLNPIIHRKCRELFGRKFTDAVIEALLSTASSTP